MELLIQVMKNNGWFKSSDDKIVHPNYPYIYDTWEDAIVLCISIASRSTEVY